MIDKALAYLKEGDADKSLELIMEAKKYDLITKDLNLVIALSLYSKKDTRGALRAVQGEITQFPDNKAAREFYEDLCSEMMIAENKL